jgi:hypothetical protein
MSIRFPLLIDALRMVLQSKRKCVSRQPTGPTLSQVQACGCSVRRNGFAFGDGACRCVAALGSKRDQGDPHDAARCEESSGLLDVLLSLPP